MDNVGPVVKLLLIGWVSGRSLFVLGGTPERCDGGVRCLASARVVTEAETRKATLQVGRRMGTHASHATSRRQSTANNAASQ